MIFNYWR